MEIIDKFYNLILDKINKEYIDVYHNSKDLIYRLNNYTLKEKEIIRVSWNPELSVYDRTHPKNINKRIDIDCEVLDKELNSYSVVNVSGYNNLIEYISYPVGRILFFDFETIRLISSDNVLLNTKSRKTLKRMLKRIDSVIFNKLEVENSFHYCDDKGKNYYSIKEIEKGKYLMIDSHGDIFTYIYQRPIIKVNANYAEYIGQSILNRCSKNIYIINYKEFEEIKNSA